MRYFLIIQNNKIPKMSYFQLAVKLDKAIEKKNLYVQDKTEKKMRWLMGLPNKVLFKSMMSKDCIFSPNFCSFKIFHIG